MADLISGRIEGDTVFIQSFEKMKARHLLRDAIEDIGDAVEQQAQREAPRGETGNLQAHPVDRDDVVVGVVDPRAFSIGGGVTARGAGGRFVKGGFPIGQAGETIARTSISVAKEPKHAIWVHNGTGIYGQHGKPIVTRPPGKFMKFYWFKGIYTKNFRLKKVKGQKPNPYLQEAFLLIERTYIPARVQLLREQIKIFT